MTKLAAAAQVAALPEPLPSLEWSADPVRDMPSPLGNPSWVTRPTVCAIIPDVSLFASNGTWGHYYVVCWSDIANGGSPCTGAPSTWSGFGGTSLASPIMAAIQALVNQTIGGSSGNPNPTYYSLAAAEYGVNGNTSCNSTLGNSAASTCIFYDVTQGDADVPCTGVSNCYLPSGTWGVLSTSDSSYQPAYGTTTGWDFATGIGSVNAANLVNNWPFLASLSQTSLSFGDQLIGVTSAAQTITLADSATQSLTIASIAIAGTDSSDFAETQTCGTGLAAGANCTITVTFTPTAQGARSASLVITDDASGSPQTVALSGIGLSTTLTQLLSSQDPTQIGQLVTFMAQVSGAGGTPTGTVTFFDGATSLGTGVVNGSGVATFTTSGLAVGFHSITAQYAGDTNFGSSTSAAYTQVTVLSFSPTSCSLLSIYAFGSACQPSAIPGSESLFSVPSFILGAWANLGYRNSMESLLGIF